MNWKQNELDDSNWIVLADSGLNIFSRYGEELFLLFFYPFSSVGRIMDKTVYTEAMFKYKKWLYGNLKIRSEATTLTRLEVRQRVLNLLRVLLTVLNAYLLFASFLSLNEAGRVDNAKDFFYN